MSSRLHFLDNLRTFLIFLVVLYHASIAFQPGFEDQWIVSDTMKSNAIGLIGLYGDVFAMFLIFFISGYFIPITLKKYSVATFLKIKFTRTIIPWMLAVMTLIPLYKVIFLYSRSLPQEEWQSYFHFFKRTGSDLSIWSNDPTQQWLWFLPVLFLFQILYLVLSKTKLLHVEITLKQAVLGVFILGLLYSLVISNLGLRGWTYTILIDFQRERLLVYFLVFLLGSLCYKLKVFDSDQRNRKYLIIANVVLGLGITVFTVVALNLFLNIVYPDRNYFIVSRIVDVFAYYTSLLLTMLSFLYILLDLFRHKLNGTNSLMRLLNRNSYQVYIIHMVVIGAIALLIMKWSAPVYVKFPILTIASYFTSNLLVYVYHRAMRLISGK